MKNAMPRCLSKKCGSFLGLLDEVDMIDESVKILRLAANWRTDFDFINVAELFFFPINSLSVRDG